MLAHIEAGTTEHAASGNWATTIELIHPSMQPHSGTATSAASARGHRRVLAGDGVIRGRGSVSGSEARRAERGALRFERELQGAQPRVDHALAVGVTARARFSTPDTLRG